MLSTRRAFLAAAPPYYAAHFWLRTCAVLAWQMVHGKWYMANGKWQMVHGKWYMANGTWQMVHGTWQMVHGTWYMGGVRKALLCTGHMGEAVTHLAPRLVPLPQTGPHSCHVASEVPAAALARTTLAACLALLRPLAAAASAVQLSTACGNQGPR